LGRRGRGFKADMADGGGSAGAVKPDMSTAVNRPGGVKALLQQLNTKFVDSHVKLPDGTTVESSLLIYYVFKSQD
jgi:hypothetical protein